MPSLNATSVLPNPLTPLAFLAPQAAYQETVTNYCTAGALAVLIWDILDNAKGDYRSIFQGKSRFSIPILAYILSRYEDFDPHLTWTNSSNTLTAAPIGDCIIFNKVVHSWCPISICCSALLFFFRLRAIYNRNQIVVATFFVFWIGLIVAALFVPLGISAGAIGPTRYCRYTAFKPSSYAGLIGPLIYDTLVFAAISWRLIQVASVEMSCRDTLHILFSKRGLPAFTARILVDGQLYYLITMLFGIATVALVYAPSVPIPLKSMGINPYLAVVNIMACRVFRNTRAGLIRESQISTSAVAEEKMCSNSPHRVIISIGQDTQMKRDAELSDVEHAHSLNSSKTAIC
ncbi:hypothetical protein HYPSUDRAFT_1104878 [Hypholoma sublateritium FD-334 SS-4]|uniref:Glucose receptor Git3 N-terminal domain-containing protein n=1 Tax=Hypholoma sublateritium (strain FD-334 SS-4) TaxID=945553 RepID=A0A0D2NKJ1_HYPSF|nr:hypothetical protein HYPSUDRAFT_1104878 [Hypholoma sublateritium FD-334 SS-4]